MTPPDPRSLAGLIAELEADPALGVQRAHSFFLDANPPCWGALDPALPEPLARALATAGIERLWSHQAAGIEAARRGRDVLLTTPTASGKSLVFQLPVLEEVCAGRPAGALFLFPLKALGQDQLGKLERLAVSAGLSESLSAAIYDGDTPRERRDEIRRRPPRVLVTNPDMLHLGILGQAASWTPFLSRLRWIVLDELHTYRGIFGSHFHHVLQRLFRLARAAGAEPSLVASSATVGNAAEFARALTGREPRLLAESGAPREGRHLLLFKPRRSPYTLTLDLLVHLLERGLKTIVFTKARRITELLYSWLRRGHPRLAEKVASYRAGFLPDERRAIEGDLFAGRLDGVITTSALEMGIDVGGLDACILVGYPGSMMATWQRSGRVGRASRESLTALVALPDALDQYFLEHPREFLERPCERLIVDPANGAVARAHLLCAAAERSLSRSADGAYLERHAGQVEALLASRELLRSADGAELFAVRRRPHGSVHLRGGGERYSIRVPGPESTGGAEEGGVALGSVALGSVALGSVALGSVALGSVALGTVDGVRVYHECHPGAVYLHGGRQFLVHALDAERRQVRAEAADVEYFTTPLTEKDTEILEVLEERRDGPLAAWLGRLRVTERVVGYERKRIRSQESLGQHGLDLPPVRFETVGLWWSAGRDVEESLRAESLHFMGSLHAAEHASIALLPVLALCDRGDIGGISMPFHPQVTTGAVFLYDGHAGGVGITAGAFARLPELLGRVAELLAGCPCEAGCPSCVQSPKCGNGNRPLDKAGARRLLDLLLGRAAPVGEPSPPPRLLLEAEPEPVSTRRPGREPDSEEPRGIARGDEATGTPETETREAATPGTETPEAGTSEITARPRASAPGAAPETPAAGELRRARTARRRLRHEPARRVWRSRRGWGSMPRRGPAVPPAVSAAGRSVEVSRPETEAASPRTLLFDLETRRSAAESGGWGNAHRMGLALGVVCFLEEGRLEAYTEDRVGELVAALQSATLVVGFNSRRFDYRVLAGYTGEDYSRTLPTLDLLEDLHRRLGFRLGLGPLAEATLGDGKSADGLRSLGWVRDGRLDLVEAYCRRDVEILRDLYLFGRREGFVFYREKGGPRRLKVRVSW